MNIKKIEPSFRKQGVYYDLLLRNGDYAIFSLKYNTTGPIIGHDVVRIGKRSLKSRNALESLTGSKITVSEYDYFECYPKSSDWGTSAWSFNTFEAAKNKLDSIIEKKLSQ